MKLYNSDGRMINATKEQYPALKKTGWSRTAPEVKEEEAPAVEETAAEEVDTKAETATKKVVKRTAAKKIAK